MRRASGTIDAVSDTNDVDRLVQRAVAGITNIAARAARFSTRLLLMTLVLCIGGFALGVAALSGGIETVWIVLGIVFGTIAISSAVLARWRVGAVKRHAPQLANEMRALVTSDNPGDREVVEVFTVDDPVATSGMTTDGETGSAVVMSRQMYGFREIPTRTLENSARLSEAIRAVTTFPALVLAAVLVSLVFGFLSFFFLIALAL